jgi:hypothetical protein
MIAAQPALNGWAIGAMVGGFFALIIGGLIGWGVCAIYVDKFKEGPDSRYGRLYVACIIGGALIMCLVVIGMCVAGYQLQWIDYHRNQPG